MYDKEMEVNDRQLVCLVQVVGGGQSEKETIFGGNVACGGFMYLWWECCMWGFHVSLVGMLHAGVSCIFSVF